MTTQGPTPIPPTTIQSTQTISQAAAHDFLAAYLDRATNDPALQPNASISEHGPVSRTTAAAPNLILHNLKRVQAGLGGETLGRDLTVAKQNPGEDYLDVGTGAAVPDTAAADGQGQATDADGDQAMMHGGDGGDFVNGDTELQGEAEAFAEQEGKQAVLDKEERKRKKKERRQAEKKAKAKKDGDDN
ncbi:hypothetical protein NUU61_002839 [Penicillium alfredii]|uniref:Uncharacterized protein n=1 Tax=Penicillium alfredii TaxID=1506179 RepID=A0A9W9FSE7_9EURO|nr:uncharacterized protein NUU61_002839 [Penicillium alfredii]KAJ5105492.1 hypothetical protein NUU61_002839 [Penicillium alfredii]